MHIPSNNTCSLDEIAINVCDNHCTGHSICFGCPGEKKDKTICADACDRLTAYQRGLNWQEKPTYYEERKRIMDENKTEKTQIEKDPETKSVKRKYKKRKPLAPDPGSQTIKPKPAKTSAPDSSDFLTIDLTAYPEIRDIIERVAHKYFLTPQHVIVSLVGKALAAKEPVE